MPVTAPRPPSSPLLFAMMFASQLATTIFLPGLPDIARDLATTLSAAQMLLPAYLVSFAIAQLIVGPLSDAFGRRTIILSGLVLFSLASLAAALAPNIELLLVALVTAAPATSNAKPNIVCVRSLFSSSCCKSQES